MDEEIIERSADLLGNSVGRERNHSQKRTDSIWKVGRRQREKKEKEL